MCTRVITLCAGIALDALCPSTGNIAALTVALLCRKSFVMNRPEVYRVEKIRREGKYELRNMRDERVKI